MKNNELPVLKPVLIDINKFKNLYLCADAFDGTLHLFEQDKYNSIPEENSLYAIMQEALKTL